MGTYGFFMFFLWIMPWHPGSAVDDFSDIEIYDPNEPRSRLIMVNGHMWFHAGRGKNVTFKTSAGGSIFLDNTDISKLPEMTHFSDLKQKVEAISTRQDTFKSRIESHQSTLILVATASRQLLQSVANSTKKINELQEWRQNKTHKDVRIRRFMGRLQRSLKALADMLVMDGCANKPCQHGGTCLPRFGKKYNCLCPPYRT
ncbi:EGF domain-containing protein, partial [Trichostrongylus colubriformis]